MKSPKDNFNRVGAEQSLCSFSPTVRIGHWPHTETFMKEEVTEYEGKMSALKASLDFNTLT